MGGDDGSSSSSGEEDGDSEWRAAIDSVTAFSSFSNGPMNRKEEERQKPPKLKHYQIKAQRLLDEILDRAIEFVTDDIHVPPTVPEPNDAGVRLFRNATPGIVFDHVDELQGPKRKPMIIPGEQLDEKSRKFRKQLQSAAVDGAHVIATAKAAAAKSLSKLEARESAAKAAAKREEERVAEMKKIRGERWLLDKVRVSRKGVSPTPSEVSSQHPLFFHEYQLTSEADNLRILLERT